MHPSRARGEGPHPLPDKGRVRLTPYRQIPSNVMVSQCSLAAAVVRWGAQQLDVKNRPMRTASRGPKPTAVRFFDDRTANGQPHSHALRLRRIEDAVSVFWIDPWTRIFNCNDRLVGSTSLRPNCEHARTGWHCVHGFAGVHDKIEHDLL